MKKIYILMIAVLLGGIARGQWQQTTQFGHPLGFEEFISHDSTIYASNGTQIYKTADNGQNWNKINLLVSNFSHIYSYSVIDNSIIISGWGGYWGTILFFRASFDNGNTWINYIDSIPNKFSPQIRNFNDTLYIGTKYGIYYSSNKGLNWNVFKNIDTCVSDLYIKGNNIYAIIYKDNSYNVFGLKKSNDNGNTWIDISNGLPQNNEYTSVCALGNKLYLKVYDDSLYVSDNDGLNWKPMQSGSPNGSYYNPLSIFNDTVYYQDGNTVYNASANDSIWNEIQLPYKGRYFAKENLRFLGTQKGNFVSNNYGSTWNPINNGIDKETDITRLYKKNNDIFAATREDGIFKTTDRGNNWIPLNNIFENNNYIKNIAIIDTVLYASVYDYYTSNSLGVMNSIDNGQTWNFINNGLICLKINDMLAKGSNLYAATDSGLFVTYNGGQNWVSINVLNNISFYKLDVDNNKLFVTGSNGLYMSADNGISWVNLNNTISCSPFAVENNQIYAGCYYDGVFSNNFGASWTATNNDYETSLNIQSSLIHSNLIFLGGYIYLHKKNVGTDYARFIYSTDNGQSWKDSTMIYPSIFPNDSRISSMIILNDTLYASLNGTVWKRPLSDFVGIIENTQNTQLHLYPNPATNSLTLNLSQLQGLQNATVSIYDIQGKQLLHENISQSQTQIDISSFAKGIYIVKLQTEKECLQSKFVKE